jgi:hypothetical protein
VKDAVSTTIDLGGPQEFSKCYWLRGSEEARLRALFTPLVAAKWMDQDPGRQWSVEKAGDWLFVYVWKTAANPSSLGEFCVQAALLARLFL